MTPGAGSEATAPATPSRRIAIVGGGIVGLFTARHLERLGASVTVFEPGALGEGSIHAAGIIEPTTAYRTNTLPFLRRVVHLWRDRTCRVQSVDPRWALESVRQFERAPLATAEASLRTLSRDSVAQYAELSAQRNDFDRGTLGLVERFDRPPHFAEQRAEALERSPGVPVEVRDDPPAGALYFPEVSWVRTERLVERLARELRQTEVVRAAVEEVGLDGSVRVDGRARTFDAIVACPGVRCRHLGVPVTGVRGYGWRVRSSETVPTATIWVDRGIALVPYAGELKVTGGWDFDLGSDPRPAARVLEAIRDLLPIDEILEFRHGSRPCTPDGLPTVGRKGRLVVATGGFRLGWSFAPSMGRHAAELALGQAANDPFLARFCGEIHGGSLGG